jgi:hypothetical protein
MESHLAMIAARIPALPMRLVVQLKRPILDEKNV